MSRVEISSRQILLFVVIGLILAVSASLGISKKLSDEVSLETRNRDLALVFGAIEAGPLAIARLQSSAISQEQLNLLMSNPQLDNRGFLSVQIAGGPNLSYKFAEWNSKEKIKEGCLEEFKKTFEFVDAINPFLVTVTRNSCQIVAEQREIFNYSAIASLLIMFVTLLLLGASLWPVAQSIQQAEIAFSNRFKSIGTIYFKPIRALVNEGIRSVELEKEQALTTQAQQLSHDIRSPLSALNIAVASLKDLPQEKLAVIQSAASRINDIAGDLLNQRRLAQHETFDVKKAVDELIAEKRIQLAQANAIKLNFNFQGHPGLAVPMDKTKFSRILSNLINNAVEALPDRGEVSVHVRSHQSHTEISVIDDGKGIPAEIASRLGQQSITYGKESGSGLGILHARRTIEEVGGTLQIQSKVSVGTLVRLTFPNTQSPSV